MKIKFLFQVGVTAFLLCFLTINANAQKRTVTSPTRTTTAAKATGVSAADQKAIREIFSGVDPSKYRLQFNNRKDVLGTRKVEMTDVQQIKRITNPAEAAGWIVFVVEGDDVVYVLAVGSSDLVSVIGKEKAMKLNAIMSKYQR